MRSAFLPLVLLASPLAAQPVAIVPTFGTEIRYEQTIADSLLGTDDAIQFHARPGLNFETGDWSLAATSDAAVRVRRYTKSMLASDLEHRPEAIELEELKLQYSGLPGTAISVGRQRLGIAGAAFSGDRIGDQTFDAARVRWSGLGGLSADVAFAWASSSNWVDPESPLATNLPGESLFAQLGWTGRVGTLSTYAYQIDQRREGATEFRLLNQVIGARFQGERKLGEDIKLSYSAGYVRQIGSVANAVYGSSPIYWQMGSSLDFGDLSATQTSYRRFSGTGISTVNGDTLRLATSATRGRLTVGAAYSDFRPLPEYNSVPSRDLRLSLGLLF